MKRKSLIIIVTFIIMIFPITTPSFALNEVGSGGGDGTAILTPGSVKPSTDATSRNSISKIGGEIIGIIQSIGTIVSVIILVVVGIKYMIGSAEERAEYKKTMMPYVVGSILLFGAVTIATLVYQFANSLKLT